MLEALLPVIGTLNETLPDTSDSMYQSAALALTLHKIIKNLSDEGFTFRAPEVSDFTTYRASLSDYLDAAYERETEIIQQGFSNVIANLPDVLTIGAAFASGGASAAGACILEIILGKLLGGDSGAQGEYASKSIDMSEVVSALEAIDMRLANLESSGKPIAEIGEEVKEAIYSVLTEFNIHIVKSDDEEATFSVGFPLES